MVAHGTSPQGAQNEEIENDEIRKNDQKLKTSELDYLFKPWKTIKKIPLLKACKEGCGTNPEQQQKAKSQPDGKGNKKMIGGIRPYNQFSGHERMEAPTGLCTSKGEFSGFPGDKLYFGNFVPVALKDAFVVFPGIFQEVETLLFDDNINRITVQQKSVGDIERSGFQDNGIPFVDNNPRRGITVFFGLQGNMVGAGLMGNKSNHDRNSDSECQGDQKKKNGFFYSFFHAFPAWTLLRKHYL